MTTHSLSLAIDVKPAKAGADSFISAIAMVKRAVRELERDASGAFASLRKPDTSALREITRESKTAGTALEQAGSASDRAAATIQRTALASAMAIRQATTSAQKLEFRLSDLGDVSGLVQLEQGLNRLKLALVNAQTPLDVRVARSAYEDLRTGLTQTATAAEYAKGDLAQLSRQQEDAARSAAKHAAALDALRSEFNPLFAASKQYESTLERIATAEHAGIISAQLAARARSQAADTLAGFDRVGQSASKAGYQIQNASYQVGDFFVQVAAGTDATRALAMQLPQLLGGFGMWGAVAGAVAAIMGALVPLLWAGSAEAKTFDDVLGDLNSTLTAYLDSADAVNGGTNALREEFGLAAESAQKFHYAMSQVAAMKMETQLQEGVGSLAQTLEGVTGAMNKWDMATFLPEALRPETLQLTAEAAATLREQFGLTVNQARQISDALSAAKLARGPEETSASMHRLVQLLLAARNAGATLPPELIKATEEAAQLGLTSDRLSAILKPLGGMVGEATAQTNAWAFSMGAVATQVNVILGALASIGGGVLSNAAKASELASLKGGASVYDAAAARQRAEFEQRMTAEQMAADAKGGVAGWLGGKAIDWQRQQFEEGLRLDKELQAAREAANKSSSGGGGGRVEALGDESRQLGKISKQLNDRIFQIGRENQALQLLATGQARTKEGAEAMAMAMELGGGKMDAATGSTIRLYEEQVRLNEQLQRAAADPYRDYVEDLPTALEAVKQLRASLAQTMEDGLTDVFMGDFDPKKIVDSIRQTLARSLAQRTMGALFGGLMDPSGVAQGAATGAKLMSAGILSASAQGAAMYASAIAGGAVTAPVTTGGLFGGAGLFGGLFKLFGFAEGGYSDRPGMTSHLVSPAQFRHAPHYAQGTPNTSGIPAVLHPNEAVVPLTKGRKIPVDASGLDAPGGGNSIVQNFGGVSVSVESTGDSSPQQAAQLARSIGDMVQLQVSKQLSEAAQYGGVLNPRGYN